MTATGMASRSGEVRFGMTIGTGDQCLITADMHLCLALPIHWTRAPETFMVRVDSVLDRVYPVRLNWA